MNRSQIAAASFLGALVAVPVCAGDSLVDRWANRKIEGTFASTKSSLALEYCLGRLIPFPAIIHGEGIVEIDSMWAQEGVRINESADGRTITFVANPRLNDHTTDAIKSCL